VPKSVRLSREEAWAELERAHTGILTTLRADGVPIALPVWFVALDEKVYVSAPARTKKLQRIRRDPRVSFLVESGERWAELCAVHLTGSARVVDDPAQRDRVQELVDEKYASFRSDRSAMPDATRQYYAVPTEIIEIVPDDRILTWDNTRLGVESPR
jgi:PPOX class probable F420-dependent enzyme